MTGAREQDGGTPMTGPVIRGALLKALDAVEMDDTGGLARWTIDCCTTLLGSGAAGLVELADAYDHDTWTLTTSHAALTRLVDGDLDGGGGPFHECLTNGDIVTIDDLSRADPRWRDFAAAARGEGFAWLHAQPLRSADFVVGALLLLGAPAGTRPTGDDLQIVHALAALAVAGGAQRQRARLRDMEIQQLQTALESRIVIEQAKGILAARHGLDLEQAFRVLRKYARDHRTEIHAVAHGLVHRRGLLDGVQREH